jgi:hypothetical protein
MLRVTIDLADISDYRIEATEGRNPLPQRSASCEVTGHDRRQSVWTLLAKAAEAACMAKHGEIPEI